jgi:hypothetical protein
MTATASTSEIRHWARTQGMTVGDRGRLSPEILTAYAASQSPAQQPTTQPAQTAATVTTARAAEARPRGRVVARPVPGATGITRTISARAR